MHHKVSYKFKICCASNLSRQTGGVDGFCVRSLLRDTRSVSFTKHRLPPTLHRRPDYGTKEEPLLQVLHLILFFIKYVNVFVFIVYLSSNLRCSNYFIRIEIQLVMNKMLNQLL